MKICSISLSKIFPVLPSIPKREIKEFSPIKDSIILILPSYPKRINAYLGVLFKGIKTPYNQCQYRFLAVKFVMGKKFYTFTSKIKLFF